MCLCKNCDDKSGIIAIAKDPFKYVFFPSFFSPIVYYYRISQTFGGRETQKSRKERRNFEMLTFSRELISAFAWCFYFLRNGNSLVWKHRFTRILLSAKPCCISFLPFDNFVGSFPYSFANFEKFFNSTLKKRAGTFQKEKDALCKTFERYLY